MAVTLPKDCQHGDGRLSGLCAGERTWIISISIRSLPHTRYRDDGYHAVEWLVVQTVFFNGTIVTTTQRFSAARSPPEKTTGSIHHAHPTEVNGVNVLRRNRRFMSYSRMNIKIWGDTRSAKFAMPNPHNLALPSLFFERGCDCDAFFLLQG